MRGLVAGNRDHVHDAVTEIDRADRLGPVFDAERLAVGIHGGGDEGGIGHAGEALVAGGVVSVGVGVDHHQRNAFTLFARQPLRDQLAGDLGGIARARAGIDQQRPFAAEQQVEERLFVVGAAALAQDVEAGVVFVHLPAGKFQAVGPAGHPGGRKNALLDAGCGGEQGGGA